MEAIDIIDKRCYKVCQWNVDNMNKSLGIPLKPKYAKHNVDDFRNGELKKKYLKWNIICSFTSYTISKDNI